MLSNKDCFKNEYNYEIFEKIKNNLKEFIDIYIDGNGNFISFFNYTSLNKYDEVILINIIVQKGNDIKNNLENIINQIENDFINNNENDTIELYNFQVSKLRSSLKFIQSIIPISQSMIENNIISNLNSTQYIKLFNEELNYKENEILTDINTFLNELNINTTKYINQSLDSLKINIKSYFLSGINIEGIEKNIEIIAQSIFINPQEFIKEIENFIDYQSNKKIILAFNEEMSFHKYLSGNKFNFDFESYKNSFEETYKQILKEYEIQREKLFVNWKTPELIIDKLKKEIKDFIKESNAVIF